MITEQVNAKIVTQYWAGQGIPNPCLEHLFCPSRRWRFDYAWPLNWVALEVQGGLFIQGRHSRGPALLKEHEKLNTAAVQGWWILYCTPQQLLTLQLAETIKQALSAGKYPIGQKLT